MPLEPCRLEQRAAPEALFDPRAVERHLLDSHGRRGLQDAAQELGPGQGEHQRGGERRWRIRIELDLETTPAHIDREHGRATDLAVEQPRLQGVADLGPQHFAQVNEPLVADRRLRVGHAMAVRTAAVEVFFGQQQEVQAPFFALGRSDSSSSRAAVMLS